MPNFKKNTNPAMKRSGFKMKGYTYPGKSPASKKLKVNREMDKTNLEDGRAGSSALQKSGESPIKAYANIGLKTQLSPIVKNSPAKHAMNDPRTGQPMGHSHRGRNSGNPEFYDGMPASHGTTAHLGGMGGGVQGILGPDAAQNVHLGFGSAITKLESRRDKQDIRRKAKRDIEKKKGAKEFVGKTKTKQQVQDIRRKKKRDIQDIRRADRAERRADREKRKSERKALKGIK